VKAVLDTYDGTVKLYVVDPDDPIVEAYRGAFPDLFIDGDEMPEELRAHWRYPEDMFRVQTNMYGRYHIDDPSTFYEKTSAWSVAADPGSSITGSTVQTTSQLLTGQARTPERIEPYYQLMRLPGEDKESFVMSRPFVPFSDTGDRQQLASFMVAKSDPDDYGKLIVYEMPSEDDIDGPALANSRVTSNQEIASRLNLLNQGGSRATLGNMLLVPVNDSILYVRPVYVSSETNPVPLRRFVIVVTGNQVSMADTLRQAILDLFPNADPQTFEAERVDPELPEGAEDTPSSTTTTTTPGGSSTTTVPPPGGDASVDELLTAADQAFADADAALREGDLATYQEKVGEAQRYVDQALQILSAQSSTTTSPTTPSTTIPETTTTTEAGTPA
jgi:uncharacterized membrane protein (UPF0182 family)